MVRDLVSLIERAEADELKGYREEAAKLTMRSRSRLPKTSVATRISSARACAIWRRKSAFKLRSSAAFRPETRKWTSPDRWET